MLEAALAAGVAAAGGEVLLGGVLPTPAAPLLLGPLRLRPGGGHLRLATTRIEDNGIKFFGADGYKLSDATEAAIEARLDASRPAAAPRSGASARCTAR